VFKRILVPLDGSLLAEVALHQAADLARVSQARIVLIHVVEQLNLDSAIEGLSIPPEDILIEGAVQRAETERSRAEDYLSNLAGNLTADGINASLQIVQGDPAEEILRYAAAGNVDLIVLTTHGRGGGTKPALGAVVYQVLHRAGIPSLIIPHL
jgi:nucleotide-binding universal stress UspA family protein